MGVNERLWERCLADLKHEVAQTEYQQWLLPLGARVEGTVLILTVINPFFVTNIKTNFLELIKTLAYRHSDGMVSEVVLELMQSGSPIAKTPRQTKAKPIDESNGLDLGYTFDAFVKGKSNTLAYNACYELAKKAGESTHPSLFIWGPSGLGKTHLMQSVAHRYQKNGRRFCYFTSDGFIKQAGLAFVGKTKTVEDFRNSVNQADILIIDDIHLISPSKKPATAELMLQLYSEFIEQGKRVILASNRPPTQMEGFDSRFLSRFVGGLTVAIDPPEMDTRVQILEKKATTLQIELPKECAIFIAQNIPADVRHLEGALKQVHANAQMLGLPVSIDLVRQALKSQIMARTRTVNVENIKDIVAEYFGISVKELVGKKRLRTIARPRQIAMALTREFTGDSFPDIGQAFGGRDHTTVIHACEQIEKLRQTDASVDKDYRALSATLEMC